jgi:hypothetical protein
LRPGVCRADRAKAGNRDIRHGKAVGDSCLSPPPPNLNKNVMLLPFNRMNGVFGLSGLASVLA